ncbi:metalloendoproteinase 2-MMP-like [Impatiens glandulifera]|uniref:metalloendoproteinase 2-MMP-like n=1 Tax=Impatiens glandulifera TaxID=253017 RepID=UPI001FB19F88|nr:metalloendoproteinase 2-MMP-like [Impatiens glandulifera]
MKITRPHLQSICTLFSLFLILVAQSISSIETSDSFKHFLGAKKGDKIKGLDQVKRYLIKYGYINSFSSDHQLEDFDDILAQAIKKYQVFNHLESSGILDANTLAQMAMPRCGMPDFVNGTAIPHGRKLVLYRSDGSYYTFESSKWYKFNLTWALRPGTRADARRPITSALGKWASVSKFHFFPSPVFDRADIQISFFRGAHVGDKAPFDGPGGTLAHSGYPPSGILHFDADETWADGAVPRTYDIGTVGLHELGHVLGLGHSNVPSAVMWPYIVQGTTKGLDPDDIAGIRALYP